MKVQKVKASCRILTMMKTAQLLHLIFSLLQCIGAQQTDPDYLPCGGDNFSCPRVNVTILECYNSSMLCDGDSFCSDVTDEGMTLNSLDCEFLRICTC